MRVHTPSEHTFDGKAYAMEVQFEHARVVDGIIQYPFFLEFFFWSFEHARVVDGIIPLLFILY